MPQLKKIEDYEVDQAVDTLVQARKILNDKRMLPRVRQAFADKQRDLAEAALELKVSGKQRDLRAKKD